MSLLDISAELRGRILALVLTRPCPVDILFEESRRSTYDLQSSCEVSYDTSIDGCGYLEYTLAMCPPGRMSTSIQNNRLVCVRPLFSIDIPRVCRQIYLEAVEILYSGNKFIPDTASLEEVPLSEASLRRITSLRLNVSCLQSEQSLHNYKRIVESLRSNRFLHLTIASNSDNKALLAGLVQCLESMEPIKSSALHFSSYGQARDLGVKLMNQGSYVLFPRYEDLPAEVRLQILGYTDLAQDWLIQFGKVHFDPLCCTRCSITLIPCCCNTNPQARQRSAAGSRFSSQCTCNFDPRVLLRVSKRLRVEALEVLFAGTNQFIFVGQMEQNLAFLCGFKPYLVYLRNFTLSISEADMPNWEKGREIHRDEFVRYLEAHCRLPFLSMTITGACFHLPGIWNEPPDGQERTRHVVFYRSFIPGLQRLVAKGLKEINFRSLHHRISMTEEYRGLVMDSETPAGER